MSATLTLRPYQEADIAALRALYAGGTNRAVLYQLATGGGKTVVFSAILLSATTLGRRTAVLCHRRELVRQASDKLTRTGVPHGIIAAAQDRDHDAPVLVASIDTIRQRPDVPRFDLIVIDEAHHSRAATWHAFLESQPQAKLLGVTATPARTDGAGLGRAYGGLFDAIHCGPSIETLQDQGYLARTRCFIPASRIDTRGLRSRLGDFEVEALARRAATVTGDAVREYTRRCTNRGAPVVTTPQGQSEGGGGRGESPPSPLRTTPAIAFCVTIKHADDVAAQFRAAGYRSAAVHGGVPTEDRDRLIASLGDGRLDVLTACEIISEGVDVPVVGATIMLRPTKSLIMHLQQIGRGMRPKPDGSRLVVLDHAGNTQTHGLPEEERTWTLEGAPEREFDEDAPEKRKSTGWLCRRCDCLNPPGTPQCLDCGADNPNARQVEHVNGDLTEATPAQRKLALERVVRLSYRDLKSRPRSLEELRAYAKSHGYKRGWAMHFHREQNRAIAARMDSLTGRGR